MHSSNLSCKMGQPVSLLIFIPKIDTRCLSGTLMFSVILGISSAFLEIMFHAFSTLAETVWKAAHHEKTHRVCMQRTRSQSNFQLVK